MIGSEWIRIEGASMRPFLHPGDGIQVEWLHGREGSVSFDAGELVLGRSPEGEWIVHRIIGAERDRARWITKGDSSFASESFGHGEIWGRVRGVRKPELDRPLRYDANWLDRWIARASGLSLPPERLRARAARKLTQLLGAWRRRLL